MWCSPPSQEQGRTHHLNLNRKGYRPSTSTRKSPSTFTELNNTWYRINSIQFNKDKSVIFIQLFIHLPTHLILFTGLPTTPVGAVLRLMQMHNYMMKTSCQIPSTNIKKVYPPEQPRQVSKKRNRKNLTNIIKRYGSSFL